MSLTWDLAGAKVYLGLPAAVDPVLDPKIQIGLDTALAVAESYCDRKFMYATDSATFTHNHSGVLQVMRYPIERVSSVSRDAGASNITDYHFVADTGQIVFDHYHRQHEITVAYVGGYKVLPADLLLALWGIFGNVYADLTQSGGGAVGGQAINSITIPDVGTIRYEASGAAGGAGAGAANGLIDNVTAALLSFYRRENC